MYLTTVRQTIAIDAATCRPRWRHTWQPRDYELWPMNRGVALARGYVVRGTADGYLLGLDARDGKLLWARHVARPDVGETITMPPLAYDDLVLIGPAGGENNIRGWIGAFRLSDGAPVWRFNTVPGPGEPGAETWANPKGLAQGGGAVWSPLALDPVKGELYVAVTNPAPDLAGHLRPGTNLYTNALVALDVRTGRLRWYDQLLPGDTHDWDLTQVSPLFRETVGGRERNLIATAGKAGVLTVLDRDTHERVYEVAITTRLNADAPVGRRPTRVCPGIHGGVEWNGPAYHPNTHLLYVPAVDWCGTYQTARTARYVPGTQYMGGGYGSDSAAALRLLAPPSPLARRTVGGAPYGVSPGAVVTTSLPNRPCASPNGPAVKNSALVGPAAAPLPNAMAHRPSIVIGGPSAACSWPRGRSSPSPRKCPGSKALMWPSPKLPTSRSPLNVPKSAGATASPHGELSRPVEATRRSRLPSVSKAFTNPCPTPATSSCLSASWSA